MHVFRLPALLLSVMTAAACASNPSPDTPTGATVIVDNRSSLTMDVYLRRRDQPPTRLGFAPANETTRFAISPALSAGAGLVRFEARPSLGGEPTSSDLLSVAPGDELSWVIPAQ
ncbi:MAG TPA: hypothetical protein VFG66_13000 [Gemmatimonadales bacterium]|nr:hypothetical protein [Gemmatimonadales bacterium]